LYNASLSLVDVYIVRTGRSNNFSLSYGGSTRGEGFEIDCAHFSSEIVDCRDLKLYNASLSLVDVHTVMTGRSNHFSMSYGGSKKGGGCKIACVHFSSYMALWGQT
jgi:hypothetical protein